MNETRTAISGAQYMLNVADEHGVKLPKNVRADIERELERERLIEAYTPAPVDLREAIMDALEKGHDPITDSGVTAAVIYKTVALESGRFQSIGAGVHAALNKHRDAVIDALKPAYQQAAEALTEAHRTLTAAGITTPDDDRILRTGTTVFTAAGKARELLGTLNKLASVRARIAPTSFGSAPRYALCAFIDPEHSTLEDINAYQRDHKGIDAWALLTHHITPSLANFAEQQQRADTYAYLQDQAEEQAQHADTKSHSYLPSV